MPSHTECHSLSKIGVIMGNVAPLWQLVKSRESRVWFWLVIWSQCIKVELVGHSLNINTTRKENFGHSFPARVKIASVLSMQKNKIVKSVWKRLFEVVYREIKWGYSSLLFDLLQDDRKISWRLHRLDHYIICLSFINPFNHLSDMFVNLVKII